MRKEPTVIVMGLIGSGKSTLISHLEDDGFYVFKEPVETNPFLEDYYKDPKRWAYAMQVNLLHECHTQSQEAYYRSIHGESTALDSSMYAGYAFAIVQKQLGFFTDSEYLSYQRIYDVLTSHTPYPDYVIHLNLSPSKAMERIKKRGRSCEKDIEIGYLEELNRAYNIVYNELEKHTNIVYVDASEPEDDVYSTVKRIISERK